MIYCKLDNKFIKIKNKSINQLIKKINNEKKFNIFFIASIIALLPGQSKGQEQEEDILEIQGKKIQDFNKNVKKLAEKINILESTDELLLKDFTETANLIKTISKLTKEVKELAEKGKFKPEGPNLLKLSKNMSEISSSYINNYKPILYDLFKIKQANGLISLTYYDPRLVQSIKIYLNDPLQNIGPNIKPIEHQEKQFSSIHDQLNQLEKLNNFNKESRKTGQLTLDRFNLTTSLINKINDLKIELIKNNILSEELQSTINKQINKQKKILYNLFEARQAVDDNNEPMPGVIYITYDAKSSRFDFILGKRRTITITDPLWKIGPSIEKIKIEQAFDLVFQELETVEGSVPWVLKQYIDTARQLNNFDLVNNILNIKKQEIIMKPVINEVLKIEISKGGFFSQEQLKKIFKNYLLNEKLISAIRNDLVLWHLSIAFDLAFQELETVEGSVPWVLKQYIDEARQLNNLDLAKELNLLKEDLKESLTTVSPADLEKLTTFLKDYPWVEIISDFKDKILKINQTKFKEQLSFLTYIDSAFKDLELEENSSLWYLKEEIKKARNSGDSNQVKGLEKRYYEIKKKIIPSIKKEIEKMKIGILGEKKTLSFEEKKNIITQELEKLFKERTD